MIIVRTRFGAWPKINTEAQKTQNNEFVESGLGKLGQNELDHK